MIFLSHLSPLNLLEEKEKFFADNTYNPQFIYPQSVDEDKLMYYGHGSYPYLDLAEEILSKAYHHRNHLDLELMHGPQVSDREVSDKIHKFLQLHNLEADYEVIWSASFVARTTISADTIKLRTPSTFRKDSLVSMLYHEIGTHALRRKNYEQQPWFKKKKKYGFSEYLPTEEGLAVLHGLLPLHFKLAHKPALNYVATTWAQQMAFAELYKKLERYIPSPESRWRLTTRLKRGLTDTSQAGGFSKDLVYFGGFVTIWHWLKTQDFNPTSLYFGKLSYQDVDKALTLNSGFQPQLPSFYVTNPEHYAKELTRIGIDNKLQQVTVQL